MFDHFVVGMTPRDEVAKDDPICPLDTSRSSMAVEEDSKSPATQRAAASSDLDDVLTQLKEQKLPRTEDETDEMPSVQQDYVEDSPVEADDGVDEGKGLETEMPSIPPSIRCRRRQRELQTQLQCLTSPFTTLSTLVNDMVATNTQCHILPAEISLPAIPLPPTIVAAPLLEVAPPPASSSAAPPLVIDDNLDEGFHEPSGDEDQYEIEFELELQRLRQADGPLGIRKRTRHGCTLSRPRIRRRRQPAAEG